MLASSFCSGEETPPILEQPPQDALPWLTQQPTPPSSQDPAQVTFLEHPRDPWQEDAIPSSSTDFNGTVTLPHPPLVCTDGRLSLQRT